MAAFCMVHLDLPTLRYWTSFTIMLYACVWVHLGLLQQIVYVRLVVLESGLRLESGLKSVFAGLGLKLGLGL